MKSYLDMLMWFIFTNPLIFHDFVWITYEKHKHLFFFFLKKGTEAYNYIRKLFYNQGLWSFRYMSLPNTHFYPQLSYISNTQWLAGQSQSTWSKSWIYNLNSESRIEVQWQMMTKGSDTSWHRLEAELGQRRLLRAYNVWALPHGWCPRCHRNTHIPTPHGYLPMPHWLNRKNTARGTKELRPGQESELTHS